MDLITKVLTAVSLCQAQACDKCPYGKWSHRYCGNCFERRHDDSVEALRVLAQLNRCSIREFGR